jgi:mevalonate kinase
MRESNLNQLNEELKSRLCPENDQYFFGHGKLLLSGEYFVLDGAHALALPTRHGQSLSVKYSPSFSPVLSWKSYDVNGECWFDNKFEFWHFKCLTENPSEEALFLQKILQQVRKENPHFLRDDVGVLVETRLGFPLNWGLGSSSTLLYNIAQWAYISPFELLFKTYGGSGYDIACAQSDGPISYKKMSTGPNWSPVQFYPSFKNQLFFVYSGKKKNSKEAVKDYNKKRPFDQHVLNEISILTNEFLQSKTIEHFMDIIVAHEKIVARELELTPIKESKFQDFDGAIKSLGAWGGDFILVATKMPIEKVKEYFLKKELDIVLSYDELISPPVLLERTDKHGRSKALLQ